MLTASFKVKEGMVWFASGHFYNFYYKKWANDPIPTVVMLNWVHGTHPNTGHQHNYIQCINLSYIPRNYRKRFVEMWLPTLQRNNGNVHMTWRMVLSKWPFMKFAIRRYIVKQHYILYAREITADKVMDEVVSTWTRDYSLAAMKQLAILTDRMKQQDPNYKRNTFAKSLSKYLYKYRAGGR